MEKSISVLIVDDDEVDRYILKRHLSETGLDINVFDATDGESAIEFLSDYHDKKKTYQDKFPPIIIFLDINMPLLDGFGFLEKFDSLRQKHKSYMSCVIMMFSSSSRSEDREKAFSKDFVKEFIVKGQFQKDDLRQKINLVLEANQA